MKLPMQFLWQIVYIRRKIKVKKITPADFNLFKNRVISSINIMTNKIDKKIKELEKAK